MNCTFGTIDYHNSTCVCFKGFTGQWCDFNQMRPYWGVFHIFVGCYLAILSVATIWLMRIPGLDYGLSAKHRAFNRKHVCIIIILCCFCGILQNIMWHLADSSNITEYYATAYIFGQIFEMLYYFFAFVLQSQMLLYWYILMSFSPNVEDILRKLRILMYMCCALEFFSDTVIRITWCLFSFKKIGTKNQGSVYALIMCAQYMMYGIMSIFVALAMQLILKHMEKLLLLLESSPIANTHAKTNATKTTTTTVSTDKAIHVSPMTSPVSSPCRKFNPKSDKRRILRLLRLYYHALTISKWLSISSGSLTLVTFFEYLIWKNNAIVDAVVISIMNCSISMDIITVVWFLMKIRSPTSTLNSSFTKESYFVTDQSCDATESVFTKPSAFLDSYVTHPNVVYGVRRYTGLPSNCSANGYFLDSNDKTWNSRISEDFQNHDSDNESIL